MTARSDDERSGQRVILRRDHIAGGVFIAAGALVFAMSGDLPFGTLASPGAGMMPKLVLGLLMAFGAILVARAGESPPLAEIDWGDFRHAATVVAVAAVAIALYTSDRLRAQRVAAVVRAALFHRAPEPLARRWPSASASPSASYLLFNTLLEIAAAAHAVLVLSLPVEATIDSLLLGFSVAFRPDVLLYAFLGCVVGTLVGMLPGIGPLAGISILLPVTFGLDATKAIVMLAGIYYGSQYGGSTTSILMRIPGEAASVMTCIDGYAMAQKGRAGAALCIAAVGSFIAGTFGVIALTVIAPPLGAFALRFGPPEYTALLVVGLDLPGLHVVDVARAHPADGGFGLLLGCIGIDVMTGHFRYAFDIPELGDGIGIVPVAVGLFGLGEILSTPSHSVTAKVTAPRLARTAADPQGMARVGHADRARHGAGLPGRHRAGLGAYHFELPVLRAGEAHLQDIRKSSARARSPASPARNRPTTRPRPAPSCRCWRSACRPGR